METQKTLELTDTSRRDDDSFIEFFSAREIITSKSAAKATLAVSTCIAEIGGPSNDMFVADFVERVDGNFSAEAILSRIFAESGDQNAFKEALARFISVQRNVQD